MRAHAAVLALAWAPVACVPAELTLAADGAAPDGTVGDAKFNDVMGSADSEPPLACTKPPGACVASVPAGWTIALLETGSLAPCPQGFAATDGTLTPDAGADVGVCVCSCALVTEPSCEQGVLPVFTGTAGTCPTLASTNAVDAGCLPASTTVAQDLQATPLPLSGGACVTDGGADLSKLSVPARTCAAPATCQEDVCGGAAPPGYKACVFMAGDAPCPPLWSAHTAVVSGFTATCPACAPCAVAGTCADASINLFSDTSCSVPLVSQVIDGTCHPSPGDVGTEFKSFNYTATLTAPGCNQPAGGSPTVTTTGDVTVCCR